DDETGNVSVPASDVSSSPADPANPSVSSARDAPAEIPAHGFASCLNCGSADVHAFCARCGQKNTDLRISVGELTRDLVDELFQVDSRMARTVVPFLFRPGKLTNEFLAGRRLTYSSPVRLYVLASFLYFITLSLFGPRQAVQVRLEGSS